MSTIKTNTTFSLFQNTPQVGFLSVFYATMDNPLNIWDKQTRCGHIRRLQDEDGVPALQILGSNVLSTFIMTPNSSYSSLGIGLAHLVLIVRRLGRIFTFEVQIRDHTNLRRRFRFSNNQITIRKNHSCCYLPLVIFDGWNEVAVDLREFTRKVYGTNFVECVRIKIYPNCRLRQVYFTAHSIGYQRVLNIMRTTLANNSTETQRKSGNTDPREVLDEALFPVSSNIVITINANSSTTANTASEPCHIHIPKTIKMINKIPHHLSKTVSQLNVEEVQGASEDSNENIDSELCGKLAKVAISWLEKEDEKGLEYPPLNYRPVRFNKLIRRELHEDLST